ncbi:ATP-binding protein [Neobittarella massiliensis]|uniref:ATP-binding protein n=2 Tax=Oscillospiraceae TaxID=216572 RepID=A0A8J6LZC3_9FIRM|nr:ATP-binding protein [Neobittarella massiliensis]MBC3516647.1 ATP-binding protein [Neobittarella massiliensis]SCJ77223.1 Non-motile and phage-resistance protein [uncultured Anaerotruncus sp.]
MQELSLNILDIAQNSIKAGASLVQIEIEEDRAKDFMRIAVIDDGCGMDEETQRRVTDPFYTTRTTRKVGLGVPFFKMQSEMAGGQFSIRSRVGQGTFIQGTFVRSHIDRMPLGDMAGTYCSLVMVNESTDFLYTHTVDGRSFAADTREFKQVLEGVPLATPQVLEFIREYIQEHLTELYGGVIE